MLAARAALLEQFNKLHKAVLKIARQDEVCRRFMSTPSVGAIVAITYKSALDDPGRIKKSKNAGPLLGLTPKLKVGRQRPPIGPRQPLQLGFQGRVDPKPELGVSRSSDWSMWMLSICY